jgi:hypothetical protein
MIIREFAKPVTAKKLNESLAEKYGKKLHLETYTLDQLQDARNKLRTQLSQVETMESFDAVKSDVYQQSKLMLDILNAEISERGVIEDFSLTENSSLNEDVEGQADIVMSAKDNVDKVTGWMEDTAEMQTASMLSLADQIKGEYGVDVAERFTATVEPALDALYSALDQARTTLSNGVKILTGESPETTMMGDETGMDPNAEPGMMPDMDTGLDADLDTGLDASAPAAGGEEPLGRARRESVERPLKKK